MEKEKSKIWIDEEGILNVKMIKGVTEDEILNLFKEGREIAKEFTEKPLILIDLTSGIVIISSKIRKNIAEHVKELAKEIGFKKIAIFGGVMSRTVVSFLISTTGIKNTKTFETKKEALKWLKKL